MPAIVVSTFSFFFSELWIDKYLFLSAKLFCNGLLPRNITKNENERLVLSFALCGEPAPSVTWNFGISDTINEVAPVKIKDYGYIYSLSLPALSRNMCGTDLSIVTKSLSQEVVTMLTIYVNCEWQFSHFYFVVVSMEESYSSNYHNHSRVFSKILGKC